MKPEIVKIEGIKEISAPISHVVKAGDFIYTAGQIPNDLVTGSLFTGSVKEKARKTLENVKFVLESAGAKMENVIKVLIFVSNLDNVPVFNEVYQEFFKNGFPARSCVEVSRLAGGVEFEVEAIAVLNGGEQ